MNKIVKAAKTSGHAIWSLILGIFSFPGIYLFLLWGLVAGIPAVICGHIARSNIRHSEGSLKGGGIAKVGLIIGYIGIILFTLLYISTNYGFTYRERRQRAICSMVEEHAESTADAVGCYFSNPLHVDVPTLDELAIDPVCFFEPLENIVLIIDGTKDQMKITAIEVAKRVECPNGDQYVVSLPKEDSDGWQ